MSKGVWTCAGRQWIIAYVLGAIPGLALASMVGYGSPASRILLALHAAAALALLGWENRSIARPKRVQRSARTVAEYTWCHWGVAVAWAGCVEAVFIYWRGADAELVSAAILVMLITAAGYAQPLIAGRGSATIEAAECQNSWMLRMAGTGFCGAIIVGPVCIILTGVGVAAASSIIIASAALLPLSFGTLCAITFTARMIRR
jgi:hypothetical protein